MSSGSPMEIWETLEHGESVECLDCVAAVAPLLYAGDSHTREIAAWWLRRRTFGVFGAGEVYLDHGEHPRRAIPSATKPGECRQLRSASSSSRPRASPRWRRLWPATADRGGVRTLRPLSRSVASTDDGAGRAGQGHGRQLRHHGQARRADPRRRRSTPSPTTPRCRPSSAMRTRACASGPPTSSTSCTRPTASPRSSPWRRTTRTSRCASPRATRSAPSATRLHQRP